jgi:ABC-type transport system involved in cytochrome bd biosynthesis fused ATPase/permease subunit
MDESTVSIDIKTATMLWAVIRKEMGEVIVVIVAHWVEAV